VPKLTLPKLNEIKGLQLSDSDSFNVINNLTYNYTLYTMKKIEQNQGLASKLDTRRSICQLGFAGRDNPPSGI